MNQIEGTDCKDCILTIKEYYHYASKKKCPRNDEVLKTIEDCWKVLEGKFEEIRERDIYFEEKSTRSKK